MLLKFFFLTLIKGGQPVQYGIVSWGQNCGQPRNPRIYTEVAQFINWISEKINNYGLITEPAVSIHANNSINPHTPDRFTPSHARCAENCGSALTHR